MYLYYCTVRLCYMCTVQYCSTTVQYGTVYQYIQYIRVPGYCVACTVQQHSSSPSTARVYLLDTRTGGAAALLLRLRYGCQAGRLLSCSLAVLRLLPC